MENPAELLRKAMARKQKTHPGYSLRALARDLGVSSSFVSAFFAGRKPVPFDRVDEICRRLEMDNFGADNLKQAIALHQISESQREMLTGGQARQWASQVYGQASKKDLDLRAKWYYIAILDLSSCSDFVSDVKWIARRLKIALGDASEGVEFLLRAGYLQEVDGRWQKKERHLRLPCPNSVKTVREFHKSYMLKAIQTMQEQTSPEEFARRLVTGVVIASNPENIAEAKRRLELALVEITQILVRGQCTEVYHLGVQLNPLTNSD